MVNKLLAAAAMAAIAYAFVPAHAARVGIGCSGADQAKVEGAVESMADSTPKFMAQGEIARAQDAMLKGDLRGCAMHLARAMQAGTLAQAPYSGMPYAGTQAQAPAETPYEAPWQSNWGYSPRPSGY